MLGCIVQVVVPVRTRRKGRHDQVMVLVPLQLVAPPVGLLQAFLTHLARPAAPPKLPVRSDLESLRWAKAFASMEFERTVVLRVLELALQYVVQV